MKLHLLALPHTVTRADFSHCAFTGKVQRFVLAKEIKHRMGIED